MGMARCLSCYGLITKQDLVCYGCGEKLPKRAKPVQAAQPSSPWSNLMFGASLGLSGFSMFSGHKLPLSVTLGASAIFLLANLARQWRRQLAKTSPSAQPIVPACFRAHNLGDSDRRAALSGYRS